MEFIGLIATVVNYSLLESKPQNTANSKMNRDEIISSIVHCKSYYTVHLRLVRAMINKISPTDSDTTVLRIKKILIRLEEVVSETKDLKIYLQSEKSFKEYLQQFNKEELLNVQKNLDTCRPFVLAEGMLSILRCYAFGGWGAFTSELTREEKRLLTL